MISNTPNNADLNRSASITRPPRYRPITTAPRPAAPTSALASSPFAPVTTTTPSKVTDVAPGGTGGPQPYQPESSGTTPTVPGQSQPTPIAPPPPSAPPITTTASTPGLTKWQPPTGLPDTVVTQVGSQGNPWQAGSGPVTAPGTNLRADIYQPGGDARLTDAQGRTDAAGNALVGGSTYNDLVAGGTDRYRNLFGSGQVDSGSAIGANDSGKYLSEQDAAVAALNGPSRQDIAKQYMDAFDLNNQQGVRDLQRDIIQRSGAAGRLGMGDDQVASLRPFTDYQTRRSALAKQLAADTAAGDIEDRYRRVGAVSGLRGQEADLGSSIRNEARGERQYGTDLASSNVDRSFARTNAAAGYGSRDASETLADRQNRLGASQSIEDLIYGQGAAGRGEMRTERGYQQDAAQRTLDNAVQERTLGNAEKSQQLARAIALMQAGDMTLEQAKAMLGIS